jgi:hypothetical protein
VTIARGGRPRVHAPSPGGRLVSSIRNAILSLLEDRSSCTMHRALFVSEIVERICFVLGSEVIHDYVSVPIPVLAVLARTCRAFNESAVDLIWAKASPWHLALRMDAEICTIEEQRLGADGAHTKTRLVSDSI